MPDHTVTHGGTTPDPRGRGRGGTLSEPRSSDTMRRATCALRCLRASLMGLGASAGLSYDGERVDPAVIRRMGCKLRAGHFMGSMLPGHWDRGCR